MHLGREQHFVSRYGHVTALTNVLHGGPIELGSLVRLLHSRGNRVYVSRHVACLMAAPECWVGTLQSLGKGRIPWAVSENWLILDS
jgi:hypothetical protein